MFSVIKIKISSCCLQQVSCLHIRLQDHTRTHPNYKTNSWSTGEVKWSEDRYIGGIAVYF